MVPQRIETDPEKKRNEDTQSSFHVKRFYIFMDRFGKKQCTTDHYKNRHNTTG
jgi:hypothetical protein